MLLKSVKISASVADKIDEFLSDKTVEGLAAKSIKTYDGHLKGFFRGKLDEPFEDVDIDEIVKEFYTRDLAAYSKVSTLRSVRAFLHHFDLPVHFKIHKVETVKETYTDEELKKLTKKPKNATFAQWRQYTIILLALDTGLRCKSIRNIKIDDIQDNSVIVRESKTRKVAILPFSNTTASAIKMLIKTINGQSEYLFCDVSGNMLSENGLRLSLERYCKKCDVECRGMHCFRHTFARKAVQNGMNPFIIQSMLMHSSMDMTKHYVNLFSSDIRDNFVSAVETVNTHGIGYKMK